MEYGSGLQKALALGALDELTGEARVKVASQNEIDQYIAQGFTPDPNYLYLHVIAMGAGEYYGCNKNGDYFPERALKIYHKTFETNAKVYKEHDNKPHSKSYGYVAKAYYNPEMHRVELLLAVNKHDAPDIVAKVERGEIPEVSMGCKIPHDVCSICGNKAANKLQYCEHIRHNLKQIYSDGRQAVMLNLQPTFFDISFVFRRADKIALTLKKVASEGASTDHVVDVEKLAEHDKEIPAEAVVRILGSKIFDSLPEIEKHEPNLPVGLLDRLALHYSIPDILQSSGVSMIPLKPQEFARIIIIKHGMPTSSFHDVLSGIMQAQPEERYSPGNVVQDILTLLAPYLASRSSYGPLLGNRMFKIANCMGGPSTLALPLDTTPPMYHRPAPEPLRTPMSPLAVGLLLGAMYAAHRGAGNIANLARVINSPQAAGIGTALALALAAIAGGKAVVTPEKTAGWKNVAGKWVAPFVGVHFAAAHYRNKYERGEDLSVLQKAVAENPDFLSIAAPFATHFGAKALSNKAVQNGLKTAHEKIAELDPISTTLLSGLIWRGRGLSAAGGIMDAGIDTAIVTSAARKILEQQRSTPNEIKKEYNIQ